MMRHILRDGSSIDRRLRHRYADVLRDRRVTVDPTLHTATSISYWRYRSADRVLFQKNCSNCLDLHCYGEVTGHSGSSVANSITFTGQGSKQLPDRSAVAFGGAVVICAVQRQRYGFLLRHGEVGRWRTGTNTLILNTRPC